MAFKSTSLCDDRGFLSGGSIGPFLAKNLKVIDICRMFNVIAEAVLVKFHSLYQSSIQSLADSGRVFLPAEAAYADQDSQFPPAVAQVPAFESRKVDARSLAAVGKNETHIGVEFALDMHRKYIRLTELLHTPYFGISDAYHPVAGRI